jgi:hypothetical protein
LIASQTETNLMGEGGGAKLTATTSPYHIEYIRRWFSAYTNKPWRIGYKTPPVPEEKPAKSGGGSTPMIHHQSQGKRK